jgi:hypothetical protein
VPDSERWLKAVLDDLSGDGFTLLESPFRAAARRLRFAPSQVGWRQTFFVFEELGQFDEARCTKFVAEATLFCLQSKRGRWLVPGIWTVWVFPVVVTSEIRLAESELVTSLAAAWYSESDGFPAVGIYPPIVYDAAKGELHFSLERQLFAWLVFPGLQKAIRRYLCR